MDEQVVGGCFIISKTQHLTALRAGNHPNSNYDQATTFFVYSSIHP
jgi:hypothetical protein